jgi:hypothetical protein
MQSATMFSKAATAGFAIQARPTKAQRRGAVAVRAGPYDAELVETAVSILTMRLEIAGHRPWVRVYPLTNTMPHCGFMA